MNTYQETLLGLLPPVSYARNAQGILNQSQIDAHVLDEVQSRAERILGACQPSQAGELLADWERVLSLISKQQTYAQRLANVLFKINAMGGLSIPYFIQLAKSAGYTITITEPQPFRAGINRAGDQLANEDIMFIWQVNVQSNSQTVYRFRAGASTAGERLSSYADSAIEGVFNDLKPAHTTVQFTYLN